MTSILKFKGKWRSYQKRILDSLDFHLMDEKLHIIAAPGAGKTTLGIEVISRLNQPTLVLCPTNTIKNQWYDRICKSFLEEKDYDAVSTNIRTPKFITVITYQALLASFCGSNDNDEQETPEEETDENSITYSKRFNSKKADEIIKILNNAKISVLCFDEAHHLRKEWWKALTYLVEELKPKQTVALTATPPYDVDYAEWERYEELCGEIDEVISIPELVKNNDLCPHQDFIHFSLLRDNEKDFIKKYNQNVSKFLEKLLNDKQLLLYLRNMDFLTPDDNSVEKIFENPEFYVSIASLLKATGCTISKTFLDLFDAKFEELPNFNSKQAKIFLNGFLITNKEEFSNLEEKITEYLNLAKHLGLIHNKRIILDDSTKIQKQITGSLGKLDSIVQIVEVENLSLGKDLRMVVLADYIKANDTDNTHLGVVPIWRTVKDKFPKIPIGVLCGSLIVLPKTTEQAFYDLLAKNQVSPDSVTISNYKEDENYIKITPKDAAKHCIVSLVTEMFNSGIINILIGTQALLGEGWDAPSINSLILSSTVSSYMLSNQMRGRAIRIDKNNPTKISNIWHLASVKLPKSTDLCSNFIFKENYTSDNFIDTINAGFYDIRQLEKRFEGFEAPSYFDKHEIVNGISRVFADNNYNLLNSQGEKLFLDLNRTTMKLAQNREQTKTWWQNALYLGYNRGEMQFNTGVETPNMTVKILTYKGYREIIFTILSLFVATFLYVNSLQDFLLIAIWFIALIISLLYVGIKFLRTGTVEGVLRQIAIVHLETLSYSGLIKTSLKNAGISIVKDTETSYIACKNLPVEENNLLIKSMKEFLDPIDNPRYLLIKRDKFCNIIKQTDYFAIPSILSTNKKDVKIFAQLWKKYIGDCEIVYTRNIEGRRLLLKARKVAFSATKRSKTRKISRWG